MFNHPNTCKSKFVPVWVLYSFTANGLMVQYFYHGNIILQICQVLKKNAHMEVTLWPIETKSPDPGNGCDGVDLFMQSAIKPQMTLSKSSCILYGIFSSYCCAAVSEHERLVQFLLLVLFHVASVWVIEYGLVLSATKTWFSLGLTKVSQYPYLEVNYTGSVLDVCLMLPSLFYESSKLHCLYCISTSGKFCALVM